MAYDSDVSGGSMRGHNARARRDMLAGAFAEYDRLQSDKKAIGEEQSDIKKRMKDALGISPAAFQNSYKLWRLEAGKRRSLVDQMRECCESLGIGETLDFILVLEREKTAAPAADAFAETADA